MPAPEGAVDFFAADRRKGPTREDERFARMARWAGFVTVNQILRCKAIQREQVRNGRPADDMAAVMRAENLMSRSECSAILHVLAAQPDLHAERDLGRRLIEAGVLTAQQVDACLADQHGWIVEGRQAPCLALILMETKLVFDCHVQEAMEAQRRERQGPLAAIDRVGGARKSARDPAAHARRRAFLFAAAAVVAALVLLAWMLRVF
jgi:hypothetical protein